MRKKRRKANKSTKRRPGAPVTLELLDESSLEANYRLNPHGRYAHTEGYIKRCASQYHLEICAIEDSTLRIEKGQPVKGIMVQMRRR